MLAFLLASCGHGGTNSQYTVGGTISGLAGSVVLQNNGGDNLTVSANGSFTFATSTANQSTYNVTVLTQPTGQTSAATGTSGSGTVNGNVTTVNVKCRNADPRYVYTANSTDNSISAYAVDAATGRLDYIGKFAAGANPVSITVAPTGSDAYVANYGSNTISQYTIGANGALTAMTPGSSVAAGTGPQFLRGAGISQYTVGAGGACADGSLRGRGRGSACFGVHSRNVEVSTDGSLGKHSA